MSLLTLFLVFAKIGLLGFGGGMAIIGLIYDSIQIFGTITQDQYANIVAIAQVTPGPVAVNTATYVGYESAGLVGAIVATLGVAVPAFVLVSLVCRAVTRYKNSPLIKGALSGIRPATVGMIGASLITIATPVMFGDSRLGMNFSELMTNLPFDPIAVAICLVTVLLVGKFRKNPFIVLIIMGCIGAVLGV